MQKNERKTKFKVGDKVEIIKYGHLVWVQERGVAGEKDLLPELIGKQGIIIKANAIDYSSFKGRDQYSIDGIPAKIAWYDNEQLKLV